MIKSWKHKGLQKLFETGNPSGVQAKDAERIRTRLLVLDEALSVEEFRNYPGFRFHPLKRRQAVSLRHYCSCQLAYHFRVQRR